MSIPQKLSVLYYILLDYDSLHGGSLAENFAFKFAMPKKYGIFMKGLWLMDRRSFPVGTARASQRQVLFC